MFEAAELGHRISKKEYDANEPELHIELLEAQRLLRHTDIPTIIIVSGVEGAGKGEVVNRLNKWLDTRGITTCAFWDESDEELERPNYWKFWRKLPARGTVGIMFGSWYTKPIINHVFGKLGGTEFEHELRRIKEFERTLTDDGVLIIKFWYHMSKENVRNKLEAEAKALDKNWKVSPIFKKFSKRYDQFSVASQQAIRITDQSNSPWHLVEATDGRYRDLTTGRIVLSSIQNQLDKYKTGRKEEEKILPVAPLQNNETTILDRVDLDLALTPKTYRRLLSKYQRKLYKLAWDAHKKKRSCIVVFEGWDAAGKGGGIRRMTAAMDARLYHVISVAAPTDEEKAQHYLWRFWRHLPRAGYTTIYDRSWYGRVLVERVEHFAAEDEWKRAYHEINDFEQQLHEHGIILMKYWLHLSPEEQLRRFKEREVTPWKKHKITDEDWRNREKWDDYKIAVNDMVSHTSTEYSHWTLIPADNKLYARVEILKTFCKQLEKNLT